MVNGQSVNAFFDIVNSMTCSNITVMNTAGGLVLSSFYSGQQSSFLASIAGVAGS